MMDKFLSFVNSVKETATNELKKFANKAFMEAVVNAAAIVAAADGKVDGAEKQKMIGAIRSSEHLKVFNLDDVIKAFNDSMEKFEFDFGVGLEESLLKLKKFAGKEEARILVRICCAIGAADGNFDDDEKEAVRKICGALDLQPAEFGL